MIKWQLESNNGKIQSESTLFQEMDWRILLLKPLGVLTQLSFLEHLESVYDFKNKSIFDENGIRATKHSSCLKTC